MLRKKCLLHVGTWLGQFRVDEVHIQNRRIWQSGKQMHHLLHALGSMPQGPVNRKARSQNRGNTDAH